MFHVAVCHFCSQRCRSDSFLFCDTSPKLGPTFWGNTWIKMRVSFKRSSKKNSSKCPLTHDTGMRHTHTRHRHESHNCSPRMLVVFFSLCFGHTHQKIKFLALALESDHSENTEQKGLAFLAWWQQLYSSYLSYLKGRRLLLNGFSCVQDIPSLITHTTVPTDLSSENKTCQTVQWTTNRWRRDQVTGFVLLSIRACGGDLFSTKLGRK